MAEREDTWMSLQLQSNFLLIEGMQQPLFNLICNLRVLFDFFADVKLSS